MVAVVVPHLEIHLHVLTGKNAQAVHVEMVEKRGPVLGTVEHQGQRDFLLHRLLNMAIEGKFGETIVVGNQTRIINHRRKRFVVRLHADVGIGVRNDLNGETQRIELLRPTVVAVKIEIGGMVREQLEIRSLIHYGHGCGHGVLHKKSRIAITQHKGEIQFGALGNQQPGFAFEYLWRPMDVGRIGGMALIGEERRIGMHLDHQGRANIFASDNLKMDVVPGILESIAKIVDGLFLKHLPTKRAMHVKGIGDTVADHMDGKNHVGTLAGFQSILFKRDLEG